MSPQNNSRVRRSLPFLAAAIISLSASSGADAALIAHYSFEPGTVTGTTVTDLAGGNDNGTLTNVNGVPASSLVSSPGLSVAGYTNLGGSQSLSLDGTDDYMSLGINQDLLQNVSGGTLATFIRLDTLPGSGDVDTLIFVPRGPGGIGTRLTLQVTSDGRLQLTARRLDTDVGIAIPSTAGLIAANTTYHVAGSMNYTNGAAVLYINGIQVVATTATFTGGYGNTSNTPSEFASTIGASGISQYADGRLDEVRIYNSVESAASVQSIAGVPVPEPSIAAVLAAPILLMRRHRALRSETVNTI